MNFTEAVAEVVVATKRPDKTAVVRRKINAAISFFCGDCDFQRDFAERSVAIAANDYTQTIALSEFSRLRKFKYIKRGGTKQFLKQLGDGELFKDCQNADRYYVIGDNVNIYTRVLASTLDVGWYKYPPILVGTDTFWLLDVMPFMIIDWAAAEIFKEIGDEKSFQFHRQSARDAYLSYRANNAVVEG